MISLPEPKLDGSVSLEKCLFVRRSIREFRDEPMSLADVSQLLWSSSGITDRHTGYRTTPSGGGLFPLETILIAGRVDGLESAAYRYVPASHSLEKLAPGDHREAFQATCFNQTFISAAPVTIVWAAVYERTEVKYGDLSPALIHMEMGHAAQNVSLQAIPLGYDAVCIGAMNAFDVIKMLGLKHDEIPEYAISIGKRK